MSPLPFFKKRAGAKVGLDIGNFNLKVIEIEKKSPKAGSYDVTALGMKNIRGAPDLAGAIKELFAEAKIGSREVAISLSGENVVSRHISLPKMSEDETRKALTFELEDHIPFKPSEIYFDYYIMGDDPAAKNRMKVFLVAVRKDTLDRRVAVMQEAGLTPVAVTTDTLALRNTLCNNYPEKKQSNITLINIGDKITNILIAKEGIPYFVRDTAFGGHVITTLLQTKLEMDTGGAENLKHNLKDAPEDVQKLINNTLVVLLNETFTSLDFYENLTEQKIDGIYLSGGLSQLFGLTEFLRERVGIDVAPLEPFKNFNLSPRLDQEKIRLSAPYFAIAVGLALEEP